VATEEGEKMKRFALLGLATFAVVGALAGTALAAKPTTEVFVVDNDTSVNTSLCGFPITFTQNGSFKIITYYDSAGNPVKSILTNYKVRFTETATANGKTLLSNFPTVFITSADGTTVEQGLRSAYTVPGAGLILLNAGRVVFDPSGDVVFVAGQHQVREGDVGAFCAYFAT
jgi:hypothetical protein